MTDLGDQCFFILQALDGVITGVQILLSVKNTLFSVIFVPLSNLCISETEL